MSTRFLFIFQVILGSQIRSQTKNFKQMPLLLGFQVMFIFNIYAIRINAVKVSAQVFEVSCSSYSAVLIKNLPLFLRCSYALQEPSSSRQSPTNNLAQITKPETRGCLPSPSGVFELHGSHWRSCQSLTRT